MVIFSNLCLQTHFREELRGISRGKDAKDVDWTKVAGSIEDLQGPLEEETVVSKVKPAPEKIDANELLQRVKKTNKRKQQVVETNSKYIKM